MRPGSGIFTADEWETLRDRVIGGFPDDIPPSLFDDALERMMNSIHDACEVIQARRRTPGARP